MKKYCKLNQLPTALTNEREYFDLREGITGGLSMDKHRLNLRGITKINRFKYNEIRSSGSTPSLAAEEYFKVISYDTDNVMSHAVGVDFNSLCPSSFSSTFHEFNPYHGGIMYMPGSLITRYKCYNDYGVRNNIVN